MMQTDDNASAEFLFGKLASDYLNIQTIPNMKLQLTPGYIKRFNIALLLYLALEIFLGIAIIYSILNRNSMLYFVILGFVARIIISAQKNKTLADRFAPDLTQHNSNRFSFSFVQLLLSGAVLMSFAVGFFTLTGLIPNISVIDRSRVVVIVLIIFYVNFISDLSIAALGRGVGIFGHSHKIRTLFGNIKDLAKTKGRQSIPLAVLRLLNWFVIYYLLVNENLFSLFLPFALFSIYYQYKWEKINSASLFMEIRGEISSGKPAVLPHKIFSEENELDDGQSTAGNNYLGNFVNRSYRRSKNKNGRNEKIGLNNLAPIAARSISRIAESIAHEETAIPSNMRDYCSKCNMEMIKASNYCAFCGERI